LIIDPTSIELPSQIFYHNLKFSNEELEQDFKDCKSLDSVPNTDSQIIRICEKLVNYLKTYYEEEDVGKFKDHHCNLLSHWIYEQLNRKFKGELTKITPIYAKFLFILSNIFKNPNESKTIDCLRNISVFSPYTDWKHRMDLYDYCVDYDKIIELAFSSYEKCKKYKEYIEEKFPLYDEFERLYIPAYKKDAFYEKCKKYDPKIVIDKLNCEKKISTTRKVRSRFTWSSFIRYYRFFL
ncbi:hypothetical protein PCYB_007940, partial [Plasmodium cynomolgi strain B]